MEFFPTELLQMIFSYLSDDHVDAVKLTNHRLRTVVCDPSTEHMRYEYQCGKHAWDLAGRLIAQVGIEKALCEYVNIPQKKKGGNLNVVKALFLRGATVSEDAIIIAAQNGFTSITLKLLHVLGNPELELEIQMLEFVESLKGDLDAA